MALLYIRQEDCSHLSSNSRRQKDMWGNSSAKGASHIMTFIIQMLQIIECSVEFQSLLLKNKLLLSGRSQQQEE